jgi:hypothetical protein
MRTPTLVHLATQLRRRTSLAVLSFVLTAGLTACDKGPTEANPEPSMDPTGTPTQHGPDALPVSATAYAIAPTLPIQHVAKTVQRRPDGVDKTDPVPRRY